MPLAVYVKTFQTVILRELATGRKNNCVKCDLGVRIQRTSLTPTTAQFCGLRQIAETLWDSAYACVSKELVGKLFLFLFGYSRH